jgi:hypothetical protein
MSSVVWYILPDDPLACKFLTPIEKEWVVGRLQVETGSGKGMVTNEDRISLQHVTNGLKEWRIWATVVVYWGTSIGVCGKRHFSAPAASPTIYLLTANSFTYTVPIVIKGLGYSAAHAVRSSARRAA